MPEEFPLRLYNFIFDMHEAVLPQKVLDLLATPYGRGGAYESFLLSQKRRVHMHASIE